MPKAKLSDAQPITPPVQQGGKAKLSDIADDDMFSSKTPVSVRATPTVDWRGMLSTNPSARAEAIGGSIPWMKETAKRFVNWGANQLPTVGGTGGAIAGAAIGEATNPVGGGTYGSVIGAGVGGGAGDAARQFIQHQTGYDEFEDPANKTLGARAATAAKEGAGQAAAEVVGMGAGKVLRPTLERSIAKLYYAGKIKYGDPLGQGDLESVIHDLLATEKAGKPGTTVGDFYNVIKETKKDIGREVDNQAALPFNQNGKIVPLGKAEADSTPIVNAINSYATSDPSIVKMAKLNPAGKEAAYLEKVRRESLNFQQTPWTYTELMDRRIKLNSELAPLYSLPAGEQRVYLLENPELAFKKSEADAIRDVIYPQMDRLSGKPMGTTLQLQTKRGSLMSLENQVNEHLAEIKTKARQAKGAPPLEKTNISTYGTSSGKPGLGIHRLQGLVHTPNPEAKADKQVARAFGNTVGTKVRKAVSSPLGSDKLGNELLSMPLRELVNPKYHDPDDQSQSDTPAPQSSVATPKDLIEKAKQLNPAAQTDYAHVAVNPKNGHKIGSNSGNEWFDIQTGQRIS